MRAQSSVNRRTDQYGGPIENRTRFALEVGVGYTPCVTFLRLLQPSARSHAHVTTITKPSVGLLPVMSAVLRDCANMQIVKAVVDEVGANRVGIRLSPFGGFLDVSASVAAPIHTLQGTSWLACLQANRGGLSAHARCVVRVPAHQPASCAAAPSYTSERLSTLLTKRQSGN